MAWKDSIYSEGRQTCLVKHSERQKYKKPKFVSVFWSVLHWSADGWPYTGWPYTGWQTVGRTLVGRLVDQRCIFLILKVSVSKRVMFFEILRNIFRKTMLV